MSISNEFGRSKGDMQEPSLDFPQEDAEKWEEKEQREPGNKKPHIVVPVWVALAAMVLAIIVAGIIISSIAEPLLNLVAPNEPEIPLPAGAHLDEELDDPGYGTKQWLYSSHQTGCQVALFFDDIEGVECIYSPNSCTELFVTPGTEPNDEPNEFAQDGFSQTATCTKRVKEVASSYSWRVEIFSGYEGEYQTKFRVYLFSER
jgi:hypothetical protein